MNKTLIVPGIDGSPAPHWQNWWVGTDHTAIMVEQDNWESPDPDAWETELAGMILRHPGAIIVAHSLGCLVAARLLRRWDRAKVAGALMVAPADPAQSQRLSAFAAIPRGTLGVPTMVVASRNDPWMSFTQAISLAADWGADLFDMGLAGHINVASGFGPWAQGLELRDRLYARQPAYVQHALARPQQHSQYGAFA